MARCPNCSYKLGIADVKAECPVCKVNIPNFNWEARLDDDALKAEDAWMSFRRKIGSFKNALFGNKLRIARFVLTFAPIVFVLFPMFKLTAEFPFSDGAESVSLLSIILSIVNGKYDIGSMLGFISLEKSGTAFIVLYASLVLVVLGVAAGVLNFFVLLISGVGYHTKGNIICCSLSTLFFIAAIVCITVASSMFKSAIPEIVSLRLSYSLFIGLALFIVNLVISVVMKNSFKPERAKYRESAAAEYEKRLAEAA